MQVGQWLAFACIITLIVHCFKTSTFVRALDKIICEFLGNIKPSDYQKLCQYIDSYNNYTQEFVDRLAEKQPEFRRIAIVHCDWGEPEFSTYHDRIWYQVWMEWNSTQLDYLDQLVNNTNSIWRRYRSLCEDGNYTKYLDRFKDYTNSSEIALSFQ